MSRIMMTLVILVCAQAFLSLSLAQDLCGSPGWPVPSPPKNMELEQVIVVTRHGDRVPWNASQCWPGDEAIWSCELSKFELPTYWPTQYQDTPIPRLYQKVYLSSDEEALGNCSVGQLTSQGYRQHLANGKSLYDAYVKSGFLKNPPDSTQLYLRSDDVPRTLQSAQSLTLGMFPVDSSHYFSNAPTPSIPLHTMDNKYDYIETNPVLCPKAGEYAQQFRSSEVWKKHSSRTQSLLQSIKNSTGIDIDEKSLERFGDCLCTHHCHNMSMPKGMTKDLYDAIWDEISWQYYNLYKYPSVEDNARVSIGFLLKHIWKSLNDSVMGKSDLKFLLFSGHDTTVMPILVALRVDDGKWAPYASMILVELYKSEDKKFLVRFIYNGKVLSPPFCGEDNFCEYETLSNYLATVTPPDDYKNTLCKV